MSGGFFDVRSYDEETDLPVSQAAVDFHRGSWRAFRRRHEHLATEAARAGGSAVKKFARVLLRRVADARMLRHAWEHLSSKGGQAPGPNGLSYRDFEDPEVWSLLRAEGNAIRRGRYRPGPERECQIPKAGGRGFRTLRLRNIEDRVVERAVVQVIQPLLDPRFRECSYGFRPRRGRLHALVRAERLTIAEGRRIWLAQDLKDAFENIALQRLLDLVRKYLVAPGLTTLVERIIHKPSGRGLRQGGPLSPLLLNLYLHHHLDAPWQRRYPHWPLLRFADDVLILCRSRQEAEEANDTLCQLLRPAGLPLKWMVAEAVHDLGQGGAIDWLGYRVRDGQQSLIVEIAERSWAQLAERLALTWALSDAPLRAVATVQGWLSQLGPCFRFSDRTDVCQRLAALAASQAFEEIPSRKQLLRHWRNAFAGWKKMRRRVAARYS
jgi:retron-type reverse transcriptase